MENLIRVKVLKQIGDIVSFWQHILELYSLFDFPNCINHITFFFEKMYLIFYLHFYFNSLYGTISVADPAFPVGGDVDSWGGYVSKILYVETKESGPLGGGRAWPRSANGLTKIVLEWCIEDF